MVVAGQAQALAQARHQQGPAGGAGAGGVVPLPAEGGERAFGGLVPVGGGQRSSAWSPRRAVRMVACRWYGQIAYGGPSVTSGRSTSLRAADWWARPAA